MFEWSQDIILIYINSWQRFSYFCSVCIIKGQTLYFIFLICDKTENVTKIQQQKKNIWNKT